MKGNADTIRRQLLRLVALLLALAGLAERSANRSQAVQRLVTWFLRHGETVALDHVSALTGRAAFGPSPTMIPKTSADEALRLAASFRALAALLSASVDALAMSAMPGIRAVIGQAKTGIQCAALAGFVCTVERRDSS